jgi:FkbM family methyltransferase
MSYQALPTQEIDLFKQLPDLKVIFDVGSRDDTEYYDIYPEAEYHLFEPNTEFANNLQEKLGSKPNVHINVCGLGDVDEQVGYSNASQAFSGGEAPVSSIDTINPIITLDRYVREHAIKGIDFLKIDVEGYDYKALLGATDTIHETKFIQYEHWDNKKQFYALLGEYFDMEYVGFRNVLCMNKTLVDVRTRNRLREYISDNALHTL